MKLIIKILQFLNPFPRGSHTFKRPWTRGWAMTVGVSLFVLGVYTLLAIWVVLSVAIGLLILGHSPIATSRLMWGVPISIVIALYLGYIGLKLAYLWNSEIVDPLYEWLKDIPDQQVNR